MPRPIVMADQKTPQSPIRFRLLSVGVEQYALSADLSERPLVVDIDVSYDFELLAAERRIDAVPRFTLRDADRNEIARLHPIARFDVLEEDWPLMTDKDATVTLPAYLLQHLAVIVTGFARGVLHEKFSREPKLAGTMLPIIPVVNYIKEDLVFPVS